MTDLKVTICGAGGRMGQANLRAVAATEGLMLHSALEKSDAPTIGKDSGTLAGLDPNNILVTSDFDQALAGTDIVIDFTVPSASVAMARHCARLGLAHIIGTTGTTNEDDDAIAAAAEQGARIVKSGNMSLGVNLLAGLVERAAATLGPAFDVEIVEMHHSRKIDAPSGTALMLGHAAARGRNIDLDQHSVRARDGVTGPRPADAIGFSSIRGGTTIGEHRVIFAGSGERIELVHIAEDRTLFASGAVRAALWIAGQKPGLYSMADVLGLQS